jgi:hypothetical protein
MSKTRQNGADGLGISFFRKKIQKDQSTAKDLFSITDAGSIHVCSLDKRFEKNVSEFRIRQSS